MFQEKDFNIVFTGLKIGKHTFEYEIDNQFFALFEYKEFDNANIKINAVLDKKTTFMELHLSHKGFVNVPCDSSNENFDLPIKGSLKLIIKFGDVFNDEHDEILILPHGEYQFNLAQYIYETTVLSVPFKKVNPDRKRDKTKKEEIKTENIDPRWDKLKQLLTDK